MTGSGGRSSIPRVLVSITGGGDYWIPAFAGMTEVKERGVILLFRH